MPSAESARLLENNQLKIAEKTNLDPRFREDDKEEAVMTTKVKEMRITCAFRDEKTTA